MAYENQQIRVKGTVQGVGFRPTVYNLALECQVKGEVYNDAEGVVINLAGSSEQIETFLDKLTRGAPPLSKIDAIECRPGADSWAYGDFSIAESGHGRANTEVTADAATCAACLDEVLNPRERRHLYPFTNCTHCGPRLSIIQDIPYDRATTTMRDFPMCADCAAEYKNPRDRRFHAQPVACHACGPRLFIAGEKEAAFAHKHVGAIRDHTRHVLAVTVDALRAGLIVAVKGLGGFHLCCDAANHEAVCTLRRRKQRYAKPFALMCHDRALIARYAAMNGAALEALESPAAPIVLMEAKTPAAGLPRLSAEIAPGSNLLGFMLPYTPLHALLCRQFGGPLVMTSGNLSGEPQIIDNDEATARFEGIADLIVCHDRDIANRIDDSVVRVMAGKARLLRRARGYAPRSVRLPEGFAEAPPVLAYGAELKSTFCLLRDGGAILSQHQGDLEDLRTFEDFEKNLGLYQQLFQFGPQHLAIDMHPEYLSAKRGRADAEAAGLPLLEIQHHHAHIASAMAEYGLAIDHGPVLGIALDGLGYGADNTLWGGEILLATYTGFERLAALKPVMMPGGAMAAKEPWRNALAHILDTMSYEAFMGRYGDTALARLFREKPTGTLMAMMKKGINCPPASSAGRLFDAVAAAVGLHPAAIRFEGQAAIELEMLADADAVLKGTVEGAYRFLLQESGAGSCLQIDAAGIWPALLDDLKAGVAPATVATRFHAGLVNALMAMVERLAAWHKFADVVLSGGCLQNRILFEALARRLEASPFRPISHTQVPANDGGIALGQAVIAAARLAADSRRSTTSSLTRGNNHVLGNTG